MEGWWWRAGCFVAPLRNGGSPDQCDTDDDGDGYLDEGGGEAAEGGAAGDLGGLVPVATLDQAFAEEGKKASTDAGSADGADEWYWDENGAGDGTDHGTDDREKARFAAASGLSGADGGGEDLDDFTQNGDNHKGDEGGRVKDRLGGE